MKKLGLFFALFSLMLLTSCEKEEENTTSEEVVTEEEEVDVDGDEEDDINEDGEVDVSLDEEEDDDIEEEDDDDDIDDNEEDDGIDDDEEDDDIDNNQGDDEGEEDTDKEDEISLEEKLIGTWNSERSLTMKTQLGDFSESSDGTMTFNKDGSGTEVYDNEEESFTWTVNSSNELIINDEVIMSNDVNEADKQEFSGTYEEDGATISAVLKLSK